MFYSGDLETTNKDEDNRVWAWGLSNIYEDDDYIYDNNINTFFQTLFDGNSHTVFFHNLKFDVGFLTIWLFKNRFKWVKERKDLIENSFTTVITDKNQFYKYEICYKIYKGKRKVITLIDSAKIFPNMSVSMIGKTFGFKEQKLKIDYEKYREIGYILADDEIKYLKHDVVIMGKALRYMYDNNLKSITMGSNALNEFKTFFTKKDWEHKFPDLTSHKYHYNIDKEIRESYRGGFTHCCKYIANSIIENGIVLDVNSLYPSVLYYMPMPYGEPLEYEGDYNNCSENEKKLYNLYVQQIAVNFELKKGKLPTLLSKNKMYGKESSYIETSYGEAIYLTLTNVDLELFKEHYNIIGEIEYIRGFAFKSTNTLFKDYIDKWSKIKEESKKSGNNGMYLIAKYMLNTLYGKFGTNPISKLKFPEYDFKNDFLHYSNQKVKSANIKGEVIYKDLVEYKKPVYVPIATFTTAYARRTTITAAQKFYTFDKNGNYIGRYLYSDTDSLHLRGFEIPYDILDIDAGRLGAWDYEFKFLKAKFIRQKCYIEYGCKPYKIVKYELNKKYFDLKKGKKKEYTKIKCKQLCKQKVTIAGMPSELHKYVNFENFEVGGEILDENGEQVHRLRLEMTKGGPILKKRIFRIQK